MSKLSDKTDALKKETIKALVASHGIVTDACKKVGIVRSTFYEWVSKDESFASAVDEAKETAIDYVEGCLFKQMQEGSTAATIFYLKTQGKRRGYIEKMEVDQTTTITGESDFVVKIVKGGE